MGWGCTPAPICLLLQVVRGCPLPKVMGKAQLENLREAGPRMGLAPSPGAWQCHGLQERSSELLR